MSQFSDDHVNSEFLRIAASEKVTGNEEPEYPKTRNQINFAWPRTSGMDFDTAASIVESLWQAAKFVEDHADWLRRERCDSIEDEDLRHMVRLLLSSKGSTFFVPYQGVADMLRRTGQQIRSRKYSLIEKINEQDDELTYNRQHFTKEYIKSRLNSTEIQSFNDREGSIRSNLNSVMWMRRKLELRASLPHSLEDFPRLSFQPNTLDELGTVLNSISWLYDTGTDSKKFFREMGYRASKLAYEIGEAMVEVRAKEIHSEEIVSILRERFPKSRASVKHRYAEVAEEADQIIDDINDKVSRFFAEVFNIDGFTRKNGDEKNEQTSP